MKKDFIIIMGSDGSGKTTIATELSKKLGYKIHHFGPPKNYEDGKKQYFEFIKNNNENVICDRFHEGEAVYAPLYRGYDGSDYFSELEKKLSEKFNVIVVLAYAPFVVIQERLEKRGEDFVKKDDLYHCHLKILNIVEHTKLPKMIIDTSIMSPENAAVAIIRQLNILKELKL